MDLTLILIAAAVVFIVVQVIQGRKRRRETVERTSKFTPGVEIMTNYGLYGTIVSIDDEKNLAVLETSPGVTIKVHRQTILKVADYDTPTETDDELESESADDEVTSESNIGNDSTPALEPSDGTDGSRTDGSRTAATRAEPRFGERVDEPGTPPRGTGSGTGTSSSSGIGSGSKAED